VAWVFASVVLVLVVTVPGIGRKIAIVVFAALLAFLITAG
jgi:hypothetical protein